MKLLPSFLSVAATAGLLALGAVQSQAQERGNRPDPEEMRARMMERYREQLKVNSDDEWKVLEPRIQAVNDARRELMALTPRGRFGGGPGGRGGRGGEGGRGGDGARGAGGAGGAGGGEGRRGGGGGFFGEPSPQVQALEKAIEADAAPEEIKSKLAALRTARKEQEAKLAKAQDGLRQLLSVKQEASAVMMGLLE